MMLLRCQYDIIRAILLTKFAHQAQSKFSLVANEQGEVSASFIK